MRSRRPEQFSMLTLMGLPEKATPFEGSVITHLKEDRDGNVLEVTVVGADCQGSDEDPWWDQAAPEDECLR